MNPIKPARLADRLGIGRSAISNAIKKGSLDILEDGSIDLDGGRSAAYLARFTMHRGKKRAAGPVAAPEATAARLFKLKAQYAKAHASLLRRKSEVIPARIHREAVTALLGTIAAGLEAIPDAFDFAAADLERTLEAAVVKALRAGVAACTAPRKPAGEPSEVIALPADAEELQTIPEVRAAIDTVTGAHLVLAHLIDDGDLVPKETIRRKLGQLDAGTLADVRSLPRRATPSVRAGLATSPEAARSALRQHCAETAAMVRAAEVKA